jgi:glycine cleavage system aminomethyltransferase T
MNGVGLFRFGTQIRKSPYFDATVKWGAQEFSVYNHMYIPRNFTNPEHNFWNLINSAILCDVAVERQVEITGPDAFEFVQRLTPRNLSKMAVGQCKYVLITNADGGILNDPILLRLGENHFWLSLADSDILLWAQGVAINSGFDVTITEPDVSPLQLQGPVSGKIMVDLFGEWIKDLRYYWLTETDLDGIPLSFRARDGPANWGMSCTSAMDLGARNSGTRSWRRGSAMVCSPAIPLPFGGWKAGCCPTTRTRTSIRTRSNLEWTV